MSDEIKEILEDLGNKNKYIEEFGYQYKRISLYDSFQLLDYITNLQEENERLKLNHKQLKDIDKMALSNSKLIQEKEDYKSRCEKAIPMLKELNKKLKDILHIGIDIAEITDIENTLTGGDKE